MKHIKNEVISYMINLVIATSLSFSFILELNQALKFTYGIKELLMHSCLIMLVYGVFFYNKTWFKFSAMLLLATLIGGWFYLVKNPSIIEVTYDKLSLVYNWYQDYLRGKVPLNTDYQGYILYGLMVGISFLIYVFGVKRFNFYLLLVGGISFFVIQWNLEYMVGYSAFYIFIITLLICYFKHIYLRHTKEHKDKRAKDMSSYLLFTIPMCICIFLVAYIMPATEEPIQWPWIRTVVDATNEYFKSWGNKEQYATINPTGFEGNSSVFEGDITLDDTLVMKVKAPESGIYLRGAIRELYTGTSWESVDNELSLLGEGSKLEGYNSDLNQLESKTRSFGQVIEHFFDPLTIEITYEELNTKTLFMPVKSDGVDFENETLKVYQNDYGILSNESTLGTSFRYTVEFYQMKKDNQALIQLLSLDQNQGTMAYSNYLQLPEDLPERVSAFARELTLEETTNYDRVKAIERHLSENYTYTLMPGELPSDRDFVDYFLFDLKQGYCTYYASAMTVLTRSLGIPARYVEGYVLPEQPVEDNIYEVTNELSHAWVEVYFEGIGWIPFEPTAPYADNYYEEAVNVIDNQVEEMADLNLEVIEEAPIDNEIDDSYSLEDKVLSEKEDGILMKVINRSFWLILMLVLMMLVLSYFRKKVRLSRIYSLAPREAVIRMYQHLLKAFSIQGYPMEAFEAPTQYADRLDSSLDFRSSDFRAITEIFIKARYSNLPIEDRDKQLLFDFYLDFHTQYKEETHRVRYFVFNHLLGII